MINEVIEVRPDIAFEVRQNIKTKSELIWLSFHLKLEAIHAKNV